MSSFKESWLVKKVGLNRILLFGVTLVLYAFFCIVTKGSFFGFDRVLNMMNYACFLGFLALGVTFVIATGGIDFSIGPVMFCCALISGYCLNSYGVPMILCFVISILVGTVFGCFNGYLVAYWKVPPSSCRWRA